MLFRKKKPETLVEGDWLKIDPREQGTFVRLSGNLDQTFRNDLRTALQPLLKRQIHGPIILQLSEVHFIDAIIAATLAEFFKGAGQRNISVEIWDASPVVKQVFTRLRLESLIN